MILMAVFFFVLGAIVASFAGVVAGRLYTGEGFVSGRSRCDACGEPLRARDLVPIFSWLVSRGRARCCGARVSPLAPLSELALGALFALGYLKLGLGSALPFLLLAFALLLVLVLYDLAHQILPPPLLALFVLSSALVGYLLAPSLAAFGWSALVALSIGSSLALIHLLSRGRAMGFADAPFSFGLALLAGPAALPGFVFSFWIGAIIGIIILAGRPRGSRMGIEVPFAPFLAAGFLLAFFTSWNPFILVVLP